MGELHKWVMQTAEGHNCPFDGLSPISSVYKNCKTPANSLSILDQIYELNAEYACHSLKWLFW